MAKRYRAINQIRFGKEDGKVETFEPGQDVVGLKKDDMVALWNAGVLEEYDPDARPKDDRDDRIAALEAQIASLEAEKAAEADAAVEEPRDPETVPGVGSLPTPNTGEAAADMEDTSGDPTPPAPVPGSPTA
jgi:hypothetical protein